MLVCLMVQACFQSWLNLQISNGIFVKEVIGRRKSGWYQTLCYTRKNRNDTDSMSAAVVARNNIFEYSRDSGQPWRGS